MSRIDKIISMFDKLDDIIYEPVKAISDWITEPLKNSEHQRKMERDSHLVDLDIKKQEALAKIEEWKKDEQFRRLNAATEAMVRYKKTLTKINTEAIKAVGMIPIELKSKVEGLKKQKFDEYQLIQREAFDEIKDRLLKIETDFGDNEQIKNILIGAADQMLRNTIDRAGNFIDQLNIDIREINQSIMELTKTGEEALKKHFEQYRIIGNSIKQLDNVEDAEIINE